MVNLNLSYVYLLAKNDDTDLYLIEKPEHTFKYTLNMKWRAFGLIHKGEYTSSYYSDSDNTIEMIQEHLQESLTRTPLFVIEIAINSQMSYIQRSEIQGRQDSEAGHQIGTLHI